MSKFLLRVPTRDDFSELKRTLPALSYRNLWPTNGKEFHFADTAASFSYSGFRPILDAIKDTSLEGIQNGAIISMGDDVLASLSVGKKGVSIHWMKCNNHLIACDCTCDNVRFGLLDKTGFVKGVEVDFPIEKEITMGYYRQFMNQPVSEPLRIAEIMRDLRNRTDHYQTGEPRITDEQAYTIAQQVYRLWLSSSYALDEISDAASNLIEGGIEYLSWCDEGKDFGNSFLAEACISVMCNCDRNVFKTLIEIGSHDIGSSALKDHLGRPTTLCHTLDALWQAENPLLDNDLDKVNTHWR